MILNIAKLIFKLSNLLMNILKGDALCFVFNLRSMILNLPVRINFDGKYYKLIDKTDIELAHFFKAEKQGNMAYGKGLKSRLEDLKKSYFLDKVDFRSGDTFIDCGANVGDIYLVLRQMNLNLKYIGFEPSPVEFACLHKNVKNMPVYNIGLWNENSNLEFYVSSQGADSSLIEPKVFDSKTIVKTQPLEKFVKGKVKCLKLEAEGAEPEILEGLGEKLALVEYVAADVGFERGQNQTSTLPAVSNYLIQNNFRMVSVGQRRLCVLFKNKNYD